MPDTHLLAAPRRRALDRLASDGEPDGLFAVIRQSLRIERHYHLYQWLRGDLQKFLPHHILIAAWGDFGLGAIHYDVISAMPGVRTRHLDRCDIAPVAGVLFQEWLRRGCVPFTADYPIALSLGAMPSDPGETEILGALRNMGSWLVHGIKDRSGRNDCLYITLSIEQSISSAHESLYEFLLPFIDTALRRIASLPDESESDAAEAEANERAKQDPLAGAQLSIRELEIIDWVRKGKTNFEIGIILDISAFTVKNHLQRMFRKMNVNNRAQAVALLENSPRRWPSP